MLNSLATNEENSVSQHTPGNYKKFECNSLKGNTKNMKD